MNKDEIKNMMFDMFEYHKDENECMKYMSDMYKNKEISEKDYAEMFIHFYEYMKMYNKRHTGSDFDIDKHISLSDKIRINNDYTKLVGDNKYFIDNEGNRSTWEDFMNNTDYKVHDMEKEQSTNKTFEEEISEIRKQNNELQEMYTKKLSDIQLDPMNHHTTFDKIYIIMDSMRDLLQYKNRKYGDSALNPNNIFYKGDSTNSILIRLDDKIGRIKNNPELAYNDVCDIIGYCTLLLISMGITKEDIEKLKD